MEPLDWVDSSRGGVLDDSPQKEQMAEIGHRRPRMSRIASKQMPCGAILGLLRFRVWGYLHHTIQSNKAMHRHSLLAVLHANHRSHVALQRQALHLVQLRYTAV